MIQPPSLIKPYDDIWSGDPALDQPAKDATAEVKAEFARRLKVARETSIWGGILREGQQPTRFTFAPLRGVVYRRLRDMFKLKLIGDAELTSLAFRAALLDIVNFGDVKVTRSDHGQLGSLADTDVVDTLDRISPDIVDEFGVLIANRASEGIPPLS